MALIKCPECEKENVSDSAISCPECGYSIKEHYAKIEHAEKQRLIEEKQKEEQLANYEREEREKEERQNIWNENKKAIKKCLLILGAIALLIVLIISIINWVDIYKFRLVGDEITKYENVIARYKEIKSNIVKVEIDYDKYAQDTHEKNENYENQYKENLTMLKNLKEEFPEKYHDLYIVFLDAYQKYEDISIYSTLATYVYKTYNTDFDKMGTLQEYCTKLEIWLEDKNYVPNEEIKEKAKLLSNTDTENYSSSKSQNASAYKTLYYTDGNIRYIGDTVNEEPNGQGTMYYPKKDGGGIFFKGEFINGERTDNGTLYYKDGRICPK